MMQKVKGKTEKDFYFVAVKVFLEHNKKFLITKDKYGGWDIPGGRIKPNEFTKPLEGILARKITEELGAAVNYKLGTPTVFMRHERYEHSLGRKARIFAIGYRARYLGGPIKLSHRHTQYKWVSVHSFKPQGYFQGGWLKGVKDYQRIIT